MQEGTEKQNSRIPPRICHTQQTRFRMLEYKILILEFVAIDRFPTSTLVLHQHLLINLTV